LFDLETDGQAEHIIQFVKPKILKFKKFSVWQIGGLGRIAETSVIYIHNSTTGMTPWKAAFGVYPKEGIGGRGEVAGKRSDL
jgi:hypothetical protein